MSAPDYDKISRYVDEEMNVEEKHAFEQLMLEDEELKKEVELYREVTKALRNRLNPGEGELALQDTMEQLRNSYFSKTDSGNPLKAETVKPDGQVISLNRRRWLSVAAAAAVIIVVLVWSPWSRPDLYKQFAAIEMTSTAVRGGPDEMLRKELTEKFNDKKFTETIPLFETLLKSDSANSGLHFYYAVALLEADSIEKSRAELIQLYNGNSVFRFDAAFYIALCYLKEKNKIICAEWLNKIPAGAAIYSKSRQLLNKLEN